MTERPWTENLADHLLMPGMELRLSGCPLTREAQELIARLLRVHGEEAPKEKK